MKKSKIITTIISALFIFACSSDFLDTEILTKKTDGNFYSTPEECEQALVGCYDGLQRIGTGSTAMNLAADVMSDQCFGGTGAADPDNWPMIDEFDYLREPSSQNMFQDSWTEYYKAIFRCNKLIIAIDEGEWTDNEMEDINQIHGEARFLRAYFYFDMVRMFERVPLLTEPSIENIPQSEPDETYKLIAEDLLFAIENIDPITYPEIPVEEFGRVTKWAAQALMARVYLYYTGYYGQSDLLGLVTKADALNYVEEVISDSKHALVDTFAHLWPAASTYLAVTQGKTLTQSNYAGEINPEVVFSIKYTYTLIWEDDNDKDIAEWMRMLGLRSKNVTKYGYGQGWGACSVLSEFYDEFDTNDTRREASIIAVEEENIDFDPKDDKEYTGYYPKKYLPQCNEEGNSIAVLMGGDQWQFAQFQDYFAIRYADVLLMAAELGSPNAVDYVNQVRARAGLTPVAAVDKDVVFEERRFEFPFEGIRYWDMLRYDSNLDYAANAVEYTGTILDGKVEKEKTIKGDNLKKIRGLFQIPNNQISLSNGVLKQNPGWE